MSLRLLLVRHGLSSFNVERRIQGRDDLSVLTPEGQEQARRTGSALKDVSITAAYSSPLRRAASTCEGLLQAWGGVLDPVMDDGLLEIDLEPWSGMSADERRPSPWKLSAVLAGGGVGAGGGTGGGSGSSAGSSAALDSR